MNAGASLFVGLDAGGSKTAMIATDSDGSPVQEATGPGINLQRSTPEEAAAVLSEMIHRALGRFASATSVYACAGIAGAGREEEASRLAERLTSLFSSEVSFRVRIVHDGLIALEGAFEGESGAILIAGTGSIVLVRKRDGSLARAGGWGYLIGDEGSGHAIGAAGLRAVAAELDGGPSTALTTVLADEFGLRTRDEIIRSVYQERFPMQTFAPAVLRAAEAGDPPSRGVIGSQTEALADQLAAAVGRGADVTPRISLIGGLLASPFYRSMLEAALHARLPTWHVVAPLETPAQGALRLARNLAVSS